MRLLITVIALLALTGCSHSGTREQHGKETEAVKDFIVAAELPEVAKIYMVDEIRYFYVNDDFVIIPSKNDYYLVEFRGTCYQLRSRYWTSDMIDIRVTKRLLYAKFDTIRGCVVGRIYEISGPQLEELRYLGDAPGAGQFIDTP
jgi:hypothetical protein